MFFVINFTIVTQLTDHTTGEETTLKQWYSSQTRQIMINTRYEYSIRTSFSTTCFRR